MPDDPKPQVDVKTEVHVGPGSVIRVTKDAQIIFEPQLTVRVHIDGKALAATLMQMLAEETAPMSTEHETPDNPGEDMVASVAAVKRRLGPVVLRAGSKRPAVIMFQEAMNTIGWSLDVDGWFGTKTGEAIKKWQADHGLEADGLVGLNTWTMILNEAKDYKPSLILRVMEYVAWCEVSSTRDVYGMAENDIGDGAGANYGLVQHNNYGSMRTLLTYAGRKDLLAQYNGTDKSKVNYAIKSWMGSPEGIEAQNKYFKRVIFDPALAYIPELGPLAAWPNDPSMLGWYERLVCLLCDSRVQNGSIWSSRKPFWKSLTAEEAKTPRNVELFKGDEWNSYLGNYIPYGEVVDQGAYDADRLHEAFTPGSLKDRWYKTLKDHNDDGGAAYKPFIVGMLETIGDDYEAQLVLLAQCRGRSSASRWWKVVADRRMTDATGSGKVNGKQLGLWTDFGIGHED